MTKKEYNTFITFSNYEKQEFLKKLTEKIIVKCKGEALSLLNGTSVSTELVLYSNAYEEMLEEARRGGLDIVVKIPLVKAIVVRGERDKLFNLLSLDIVETADTPRKVKALGENQ